MTNFISALFIKRKFKKYLEATEVNQKHTELYVFSTYSFKANDILGNNSEIIQSYYDEQQQWFSTQNHLQIKSLFELSVYQKNWVLNHPAQIDALAAYEKHFSDTKKSFEILEKYYPDGFKKFVSENNISLTPLNFQTIVEIVSKRETIHDYQTEINYENKIEKVPKRKYYIDSFFKDHNLFAVDKNTIAGKGEILRYLFYFFDYDEYIIHKEYERIFKSYPLGLNKFCQQNHDQTIETSQLQLNQDCDYRKVPLIEKQFIIEHEAEIKLFDEEITTINNEYDNLFNTYGSDLIKAYFESYYPDERISKELVISKKNDIEDFSQLYRINQTNIKNYKFQNNCLRVFNYIEDAHNHFQNNTINQKWKFESQSYITKVIFYKDDKILVHKSISTLFKYPISFIGEQKPGDNYNTLVQELSEKKQKFIDKEFDEIIEYLDMLTIPYNSIEVLFANSGLNDSEAAELNDYHFTYIKSKLSEKSIHYEDLNDVLNTNSNASSQSSELVIIELISTKKQILKNCASLWKAFPEKNPNILYVSFCKSIDEKAHPELLENDITFPKNLRFPELAKLTSVNKSDYHSFKQYLDENRVHCFYHFTDRANLLSIKKNGGLYSWWFCEQNNITIHHPGGNSTSHDLDKRHHLEDYVRLSFCSNHPMSYRLIHNRADIVVLKIKYDVAWLKDSLFSDINATDNNVHVGPSLEDLKRVDIKATKQKYISNDSPQFKARQAEVLVKTFIPLDYIINLENELPLQYLCEEYEDMPLY